MKYFLGLLSAITLIVIVFILVLHGFSGSSKPKNQITLTDYATSSTVVKLTVSGPVKADQNHQGYSITVGRDSNTIEVYQGYQNTVTQAKTYGNNSVAYADFLRALQLQGFTKGSADTTQSDDRGVCPLGARYTFEIQTAGETIQRYWATSCGKGTFKGTSSSIMTLFKLQIPEFPQITKDIILGT
ncbi:MAG TPA: hypothetical protein VMR45_05730 [Patescibacteria group bacterium]|nr:hypothetical protein [Patescibacteria group bacterium]